MRIMVAEKVAAKVAEMLKEEVVVDEITKNNDVKFTAITFKREGANPVVYIDAMIEEGMSVEEIADQVIEIADRNPAPKEFLDVAKLIGDWSYAKTRIQKRLVSSEQGFDNLVNTTLPGTDLAFIYSIVLREDASVKVTDTLLEKWGITLKELDEVSSLGEITIRPITEVLSDFGLEGLDVLEDALTGPQGMLVVSNKASFYGAGCILEALDQIRRKLEGREFYVLPSSIHEVIVVWGKDMDAEELKIMVREVNDSQLLPEERLSYHVYRLTEDGLSIAA